MREINFGEMALVSGGELTCTVDVSPKGGVSCTGTLSDWSDAAKTAWKFAEENMPFSAPFLISLL